MCGVVGGDDYDRVFVYYSVECYDGGFCVKVFVDVVD